MRFCTGIDMTDNEAPREFLTYTRRTAITPTRVVVLKPDWHDSNRLLRQYAEEVDCFTRVVVCEESLVRLHPYTAQSHSVMYGR